LVAGALGAEDETAGRAGPHHRIGFLGGQLRGAVGQPLGTAEVEQGVHPMRVLADGGNHHRKPDRAANPGLQRRKVVIRAVTGVEEAHRDHVVSLADRNQDR
jgi:hypothetical protein